MISNDYSDLVVDRAGLRFCRRFNVMPLANRPNRSTGVCGVPVHLANLYGRSRRASSRSTASRMNSARFPASTSASIRASVSASPLEQVAWR